MRLKRQPQKTIPQSQNQIEKKQEENNSKDIVEVDVQQEEEEEIKPIQIYFEVENIEDSKTIRGTHYYLTKWKGYEEKSWEPCECFFLAKGAIENYDLQKRLKLKNRKIRKLRRQQLARQNLINKSKKIQKRQQSQIVIKKQQQQIKIRENKSLQNHNNQKQNIKSSSSTLNTTQTLKTKIQQVQKVSKTKEQKKPVLVLVKSVKKESPIKEINKLEWARSCFNKKLQQ